MTTITDTLTPSDRASYNAVEAANRRMARQTSEKPTREDEYRHAYVDARDAVPTPYVLLDALNAAHDGKQWRRANTLAAQVRDQLQTSAGNVLWLVTAQDMARGERL